MFNTSGDVVANLWRSSGDVVAMLWRTYTSGDGLY
jgi:hypothetical protein